MHLLLDLGQLCVAKPSAGAPCSYAVRDPASGQIKEQRVVCKAVASSSGAGGKERKRSVVLRMPPHLLRTYEQHNGPLKAGDPLDINVTDYTLEVSRNPWSQADTAYYLIETDTLIKAKRKAQAQEQKADAAGAESAHHATN
jgi:hypothetical protein